MFAKKYQVQESLLIEIDNYIINKGKHTDFYFKMEAVINKINEIGTFTVLEFIDICKDYCIPANPTKISLLLRYLTIDNLLVMTPIRTVNGKINHVYYTLEAKDQGLELIDFLLNKTKPINPSAKDFKCSHGSGSNCHICKIEKVRNITLTTDQYWELLGVEQIKSDKGELLGRRNKAFNDWGKR